MNQFQANYHHKIEIQNTRTAINLDKTSMSAEKKKSLAVTKYITNALTNKLRLLDTDLRKSYVNTFYCSTTLTEHHHQDKKIITANYCKNRFCLICNRIKTGKYINEYTKAITELTEPYFITLTVPNCSALELSETIKTMNEDFNKINKRLHRIKKRITGMRKLEVTYNYFKDNYHPHYHILVNDKKTAEYILEQWLKHNKKANIMAQDIRAADANSLKELFKYFTKLVSKDGKFMNIKALDNIFRSIRGNRIYFFYNLEKEKKQVNVIMSDKVDSIQYYYKTELLDWINKNGDLFSNITKEEITEIYKKRFDNDKNKDTDSIPDNLKNIELRLRR